MVDQPETTTGQTTMTLQAGIAAGIGKPPKRILVTGGTGFIGGRIATAFSDAGHEVTALSRNRYTVPANCRLIRADLRNRDEIEQACAGQQIVIHAAAHTSPFLSYEALAPINVGGTENIIHACLANKVQRLVHISSTSVLFRFEDNLNIDDALPLPPRFACGYAATKAAAEQRVLAAVNDQGLNAIVIRARAVFGPGDNSLVPRLLDAYDSGQLKQIGAGQNQTDLTHIDNLVYAVALATSRGKPGGTCTIIGEQPVKLWEIIKSILKATGREKPLKQIPYWLADAVATLTETTHRWMGWDEPKLTKYSVGLLAKSQAFSPASAQELLDYKPLIPLEQGVRDTLAKLAATDSSPAETAVELSLHTTGYTLQRYGNMEKGQSWSQKIRAHALIGVIRHPKHGLTLFDTGYSPRFDQATKAFPYSLYRMITPATTPPDHTALAIIQRLGYEPTDVKRILLSHFHGDHTCGLIDFPDAEIIATTDAWNSIKNRTGLSAVRRAHLPATLPANIQDRLCLLDRFHAPGIGPFDRTFDLFNDRSIRLIKLPGHATGQFGGLLQTGPKERKLLVADAVWTSNSISSQIPLTMPFRMTAASSKAAAETHQKLIAFQTQFPDVQILPTHCPDLADQQNFNQQLEV